MRGSQGDLPEEVTLKDEGNTDYEAWRESRQRTASARILWPHELLFHRRQRGLWQRADRVREGEGLRGGHRGGQGPGSTWPHRAPGVKARSGVLSWGHGRTA